MADTALDTAAVEGGCTPATEPGSPPPPTAAPGSAERALEDGAERVDSSQPAPRFPRWSRKQRPVSFSATYRRELEHKLETFGVQVDAAAPTATLEEVATAIEASLRAGSAASGPARSASGAASSASEAAGGAADAETKPYEQQEPPEDDEDGDGAEEAEAAERGAAEAAPSAEGELEGEAADEDIYARGGEGDGERERGRGGGRGGAGGTGRG